MRAGCQRSTGIAGRRWKIKAAAGHIFAAPGENDIRVSGLNLLQTAGHSLHGGGTLTIPFTLFQDYLERLPIKQMVADIDLGRSIFRSPVTGMYEFPNEIHTRLGVTEAQIDMLTKETPVKLFGI